jgi:hypothetical protein
VVKTLLGCFIANGRFDINGGKKQKGSEKEELLLANDAMLKSESDMV